MTEVPKTTLPQLTGPQRALLIQAATVMPHVDLWLDERQLANYLRVTDERAELAS